MEIGFLPSQPIGCFSSSVRGTFVGKLRLVDAILDSTAGGRPNFHTTQWGLVIAASAEGTGEARAALEVLYRLYCYPVYAFIRRRGHGRQDAQDLTQDFFVHLLEKGTLARAAPQRGRFRSFLLGALDYFLAHAAERARAGKRGGSCQWVFLDDEAAENAYQLAAPEGMTAEKIFDARWAAALFEVTFARLRDELRSEGKGHLFEALQGFLLGREDASYKQVADTLSLSIGGLKTVIHRFRGRFRTLLREEVARTVSKPAEVDEELRFLRAALRG
jgi:DNA-directed RNA polymerase specialized sigma24 family protein